MPVFPLVLLALFIFLCDQFSKSYMLERLELGQSIPVIDGIFHLTLVKNPGAAFGILKHHTGFFIAVAVILIALVIYFLPRIPKGHPWLRVAIAFEVGGAMGNMADRLRTGYVVDFFDFRVFPVFNIADMAIVAGVGLIFLEMYRMSHAEG